MRPIALNRRTPSSPVAMKVRRSWACIASLIETAASMAPIRKLTSPMCWRSS